MILGQLRIGARATTYAALIVTWTAFAILAKFKLRSSESTHNLEKGDFEIALLSITGTLPGT